MLSYCDSERAVCEVRAASNGGVCTAGGGPGVCAEGVCVSDPCVNITLETSAEVEAVINGAHMWVFCCALQ
jgi:hypothetical protein